MHLENTASIVPVTVNKVWTHEFEFLAMECRMKRNWVETVDMQRQWGPVGTGIDRMRRAGAADDGAAGHKMNGARGQLLSDEVPQVPNGTAGFFPSSLSHSLSLCLPVPPSFSMAAPGAVTPAAGAAPGTGWGRGLRASLSPPSISEKARRAASNTVRVSQKLLWSTGKAAWIAGTTFLILVVPLIIEMDREQQMEDMENQQAGLLGAPPPPGAPSVN